MTGRKAPVMRLRVVTSPPQIKMKEVKIMERTVRIFWEDEYLGDVLTNGSLSKTGAIYALGYDVNDPDDCEQAYNNGFAAAYVDDNGNYQIDTIGINFR